MSQAQEILEAAAEILERMGWTQDTLARDAEGNETHPCDEDVACLCMVGAMYRACGFSTAVEMPSEVLHRLRDAIFARDERDLSPAEWNDQPGRTKEEVISLLREAAKP